MRKFAWMTTLMACTPATRAAPQAEDARVRPRPDAGLEEEFDAGVQEEEDAEVEASAPVDAGLATRENLVVHEFWSTLDATEDPFDRPADAGCKRGGIMPELLADEPVFSVDTGFCPYITVSQPTLREVPEGHNIKVRLWHFELSAPQPAMAHAAVVVDDLHVLDEQIPIPSAGGLIVRELRAPHAIALGAPVYFHLHNHGANSWSLVEVSAGP
jgi:hypothetical protein